MSLLHIFLVVIAAVIVFVILAEFTVGIIAVVGALLVLLVGFSGYARSPRI